MKSLIHQSIYIIGMIALNFIFGRPPQEPRLLLIVRGLIATATLLALTACTPQAASVGDGYPPVTSEMLNGLISQQRTGQHTSTFTWSFSDDRFTLSGPNIPDDLLESLQLEPQTEEVSGQWRIDEGKIFLLLDTQEDEIPLPIFNTGVIRIQSPRAQYVFSRR